MKRNRIAIDQRSQVAAVAAPKQKIKIINRAGVIINDITLLCDGTFSFTPTLFNIIVSDAVIIKPVMLWKEKRKPTPRYIIIIIIEVKGLKDLSIFHQLMIELAIHAYILLSVGVGGHSSNAYFIISYITYIPLRLFEFMVRKLNTYSQCIF